MKHVARKRFGQHFLRDAYVLGAIVDLIDPKLQRSVWRGSIQSRLKDGLQNDQDKYNAAADNIFASFPPP